MRLSSTLGVSLLLLAQGFTLVITQKNGETTLIDTENVDKISFEEEQSSSIKVLLRSPEIIVTQETGKTRISWNTVPNAARYRHYLDDNDPVLDEATEIILEGLSEGTHTYTVVAVPGDTDSYKESQPATVSFEVERNVDDGTFNIRAGEVTSTAIPYIVSGAEGDYYVGIVPRTKEFISDKDLIEYIATNPGTQRKQLSGDSEGESFTGLTPNTHYIVAAYPVDSKDKASRFYTCTELDLTPGASGSIFPFGVSETEGFYDVDKVYYDGLKNIRPDWVSDQEMCWACSSSGILQWWLDDYKRKTGEDWPMKYPDAIPEKSVCYTTPIMDVYMEGCNNLPGSSEGILWFMSGKQDNTFVNNTDWQFKESYKYWQGGFMGMTEKEAKSYLNIKKEAHYPYDDPDTYIHTFLISNSLPKNCTATQARDIFTPLIFEILKEGPAWVGMHGMHALSLWGADYVVHDDGTPEITALYICENSQQVGVINNLNVINGYNKMVVSYNYDGMLGRQRFAPMITHPWVGTVSITNMTSLIGWQPD